MKKYAITAMAALLFGTTLGVPVAEAQGRRDRERFVERYCDRNPRDRDCRDFSDNRRGWDERRYNRWYRDRYRNNNDAAAAAIFGLAAGAIIGGAAAAAGGDGGHVARCEARYRSYDRRTDTYVINSDGDRARCRL